MSIIGTRVKRKEDPALLTVGGRYVDDLAPADALWITFVRSDRAHAMITGVGVDEAKAMPGVVAVLRADDLGLQAQPPGQPMLNQTMLRSALAADRVRYVGEPLAIVVSESREQGVDAAEQVFVDYELLEVVLDPHQAAKDLVLLFPESGTNTGFLLPPAERSDDPFAQCEVVVDLQFRNQRVAPCPLEPRAAVARWQNGRLTQWSSTQSPHSTRDAMAAAMGVEADDVRVMTPDVGGGFGAKSGTYPEDIVVAAAARTLDRPVRWAETRSESMLGLGHGRGQYHDAKMGGTSDGKITAYSLSVLQDSGAYLEIGAVLPFLTMIMASGVYSIENVVFESRSVVTNTMPMVAYRGAGRPEATAAIERMVDVFAAKIGMDPAIVRRKNLHPPEAFPLTTSTGAAMDCGDYQGALDTALAAVDYLALRAEQQRRRDNGAAVQLGIGLSVYVEITNPLVDSEYGQVTIENDGSAVALTGSSAHGQGHETSFTMLIHELTGIALDKIEVRHGDTDDIPRGGGTGGSKSLQVGGTALWQASEEVIEQAKQLTAELLEANPDDVVLDVSTASFSIAGTPALAKSWADLATEAAHRELGKLSAEIDFQPEGATFPFGAHVSVVDVDTELGQVTIKRHVAVDDAGTIINPMLVDGQVHGGLAQGIAQALIEEFVYDEAGNPITANFMDYGIISAAELPTFERVSQETPTSLNPLGAKGIGESGTIGSTPAVQNAVVDALSHLGVGHVEMPVTAERVWTAIQEAKAGKA